MATSYGLEEFIADVRSAASKQTPAGETLRTIGPGFKRLLENPNFLEKKVKELNATDDEVCLYSDPDYRFVILARGISRGESHAGTPHDHGTLWALYGLYEGTARFQRFEVDPSNKGKPFPGLRMIADRPAQPGDFDAIEPGNMHLPVFPPEGGSVIIVVYKDDLESVVRRGYIRDIEQPVRFQGQFASPKTRVERPV